MKTTYFSILIVMTTVIAFPFLFSSCSGGKKSAETDPPEVIITNPDATGPLVSVSLTKGESINHPLMAVWLEDYSGKYIETLFVAQSIGRGTFEHANQSEGIWLPGPVRRPAALPYWGHKRGIQAADGLYLPTPEEPVADAITGPTPGGSFILNARSTSQLNSPFRVVLEINQSWDWNEYWTNTKYPDDDQYKTSSQPAVVYEVIIDPSALQPEYEMIAVGHSHYSGKDGGLYPELGTLTTALKIADKITVKVTFPKN